MAKGDPAQAAKWYDRARRLSPNDALAMLSHAAALAATDTGAATRILYALIAQHPKFWSAHIALAALHLGSGDTGTATDLLDALLQQAAPPATDEVYSLCDRATLAAKRPGWLICTSEGQVRISCPSPSHLRICLDGKILQKNARARSGSTIDMQLPPEWRGMHTLSATHGNTHLLGSPADLTARHTVHGFADIDARGNLRGWAWVPADPSATPTLKISGSGGDPRRILADDHNFVLGNDDSTLAPKGFFLAAKDLPNAPVLRVTTLNGADLFGSPLTRGAEATAASDAARHLAQILGNTTPRAAPPLQDAWRPLPAELPATAIPARRPPARAGIDIVIPVYRGATDLEACLASVFPTLLPGARVVVVLDDPSPNEPMRGVLHHAASQDAIILSHDRNRGFPAAANTGMRHAGRRDVVLLNPDTLVPKTWLARLQSTAYSHATIGSVTPMSNDGTIVSYPTGTPTPPPDHAATDRLSALLRRANPGPPIDLPTAVGFCMFIRHDCLAATGLFREDAFAQGYGEENDWCLRARHLGWRHVADTGCFVSHAGGQSFGAVKTALMARNTKILNRLHPGYDALIKTFIAADPLAQARYRIDAECWAQSRQKNGAVILVTHAEGGGVARSVTERAQALRAQNLRPIIIHPTRATTPDITGFCVLSDPAPYPNLRFDISNTIAPLAAFLRPDRPIRLELHHLLGHHQAITTLAAALSIPTDIYIHDFAAICPRITFINDRATYCGEPTAIATCEACIADLGTNMIEPISVAETRARAATLIAGSQSLIVATTDAARRLTRYFPSARPTIRPWENDAALTASIRPPTRTIHPIRICTVGAIGDEKGYRILLACARDAASRNLPLHFTIVGHSSDDARLLDTGHVFITGRFTEAEAIDLTRAQNAHWGFVPSICPESWCYALSTLWRAGLWPLVFALGAQNERVLRTGKGTAIPPSLPPARINDLLVAGLNL